MKILLILLSVHIFAIKQGIAEINITNQLPTYLYYKSNKGDAIITIHSIPSGVQVFSDSILLGITPLDSLCISSGNHTLTLFYPNSEHWFQVSKTESIYVPEGEHLFRLFFMPIIYHITSEPAGAILKLDDSVVGITPCFLKTNLENNRIEIVRDGYFTKTLILIDSLRHIHVQLCPSSKGLNRVSEYLANNQDRNNTHIYISSISAIISGAVAAYFKIKSDHLYYEYRRTRDPEQLLKVQKYDRIAGISLALSEISLFVFTYLLIK